MTTIIRRKPSAAAKARQEAREHKRWADRLRPLCKVQMQLILDGKTDSLEYHIVSEKIKNFK